MSWPVPASNGNTSAIALSWPSREATPRPAWAQPVKQRGRRRRAESLRKAKYGVGIVAGLSLVCLAKRLINSIPVVGLFTRPVLDLLPSVIVGPALGAAVVYGLEQGDLLAARHVVREKAHAVKREFDVVARDLSAEVEARKAEVLALERTARTAAQSVEELERTVVPVLEREYRTIEAEARRSL
ncbi:hypothetical protein GPECTOR_88g473 [Gonium pectorale]|uniref:Uncharacterized protein n=1 Tax=Gonium pectorale TaxID=33097 RepID=A0A150G2J3_GONPE|nr:hypothetical protein GPECTOR_88g473 [Gonium pectorale]|eukprot:KXZ43530.1 hypothetical protein GPECTOR_88g473 [Gonium pectorale]